MAERTRYTLEAEVRPEDLPLIEQRLDPRYCAACLARLDVPGRTFCPDCRRVRLQVAKRLWMRGYHRAQGAQVEARRRAWRRERKTQPQRGVGG